MKISKEALIATTLAAMASPIMAQEVCTPPTTVMAEKGASIFASALMKRGVDFKYGQFTIFAPSDKLISDSVLLLDNDGYNSTTIDDIVLFHVSAEAITEDIEDPDHCGKSLLMLNEELHVKQESSTTTCEGGKIYQIGPGNVDLMPEVVGEPITACNSVIYMIEDALMLPTLPALPLSPTVAPAPTKPPTRQDPTEENPQTETSTPQGEPSSANSLSLALTAFAGLVTVAFL